MKKNKENPINEAQTVEPSEPDPETQAVQTELLNKAIRRRFPLNYKHRILAEAAAGGRENLGAFLRREALYSSHLTLWRRDQQQGLTPKKRGRKPKPGQEQVVRLDKLMKENAKLAKSLKHAELIIEAQKKYPSCSGCLNSLTRSGWGLRAKTPW